MRRIPLVVVAALVVACFGAGVATAGSQGGINSVGGIAAHIWVDYNVQTCLDHPHWQITDGYVNFERSHDFWTVGSATLTLISEGSNCPGSGSFENNHQDFTLTPNNVWGNRGSIYWAYGTPRNVSWPYAGQPTILPPPAPKVGGEVNFNATEPGLTTSGACAFANLANVNC